MLCHMVAQWNAFQTQKSTQTTKRRVFRSCTFETSAKAFCHFAVTPRRHILIKEKAMWGNAAPIKPGKRVEQKRPRTLHLDSSCRQWCARGETKWCYYPWSLQRGDAFTAGLFSPHFSPLPYLSRWSFGYFSHKCEESLT